MGEVRSGYNLIAEDFSSKRGNLWPELLLFKKYVKREDRVLDVGCGNGRLAALFKNMDVSYVGVDNSEELIRIARKRTKNIKDPRVEFVRGSGTALPFDEGSFNVVFSVATLHHIPSSKFRLKFLKEAKRVLKKEGVLIVTVWNLWRVKFLKYHLKYFLLKLTGEVKLDRGDIFYPWKNSKGEVVMERYLHCFRKKELVSLAKRADFKVEEAGFTEAGRNIYLVARK